jgi:hypothetical protein
MSQVQKAVTANKIIVKAGSEILKSSIKTTKTIANLYKNAGIKAFRFGSGLLKETVKLAMDNQKQALQTSSQALKETVAVVRAEMKPETTKKEAGKKKKKDLTIEEVLNA